MAYFENFPLAIYDIYGEDLAKNKIVANILARAKVIDSIKTNFYVYYTYDILDGDTPEIIAAKYYDNPNRHWIILMTNDIVDYVYDWPMTSQNFESFLIEKYGSVENAKLQIHHYEKIITKTDSVTNTVTVKTIELDQNTYTSLASSSTETVNVDNATVTIVTTKNAVSNYDYENNLNESKRKIKIINKDYVNQIEAELKSILSS